MRLIDADALVEQLRQVDDEIVKACIGVVQTQPTAYDINNVVAELIEFGLNSMDKQIYDSNTYYDGVSDAIRKACKIVKSGGTKEN